MFKKLLPVLILLSLTLVAIWPLFNPGFFVIHDDQQVVRLFQMDKTLWSGTFPVRWVPDLGFGYGYPLFNFYPPLVYYLGEIFHLLGADFLTATKIIWAISLMGSAVSMYYLAKQFFGKVGGIVSAIFYLYIPYHAVDAYVRGALSELFSFIWLPLIWLFSYQKKYFLTAISLAGLMLTHNLIFLPFVGFYLLWSRNFRSLILAMGLTAFFWIPAIVEKQYTLVDKFLTTGLASYQIHFVCPSQLWNSLWGYGGSVAGCLDGLSFKLGKPHLFVSLIAVFISIYLWRKKSRNLFTVLFLISCFLVISVFMTTGYSKIIWDNILPLWYLQFPWRFLEFAAFFSSILAGAIFIVITKRLPAIVLAAIFIFSVLFLHAKYFLPKTYLPLVSDQTLLTDEEIKSRVSATSFEYMPKGIAVLPTKHGSYMLDIKKFATNRYVVILGNFQESESNFSPNKFSLSGKANSDTIIQFQVTYFPGWKIFIDDEPVSIDDNNKLKLMTVNIPVGQHKISGYFVDTLPRSIGNLISVASVIILVIAMIYGRKRS